MNNKKKNIVVKIDNTPQSQRAAYSQFEIEKRQTHDMDGQIRYTGYYLLNLQEWTEPLTLEQLTALRDFLNAYLTKEQ